MTNYEKQLFYDQQLLYSCASTVFRCAYGACIDGDLRCNGVVNCADGSDEDPILCGGKWPFETPRPTPAVTPTATPAVTPTATPAVTPATMISCKAPPQPPNGQRKLYRSQCNSGQDCDVSEGVHLQLGSHLIYSCNPGYNIRGATDVICNLEGNWLNIPVCIGIKMIIYF